MSELVVVTDTSGQRLLFETDGQSGASSAGQVGAYSNWKDIIFGKGDEGTGLPGRVEDVSATITSLVDAVRSSFDGLATDKSDGGKLSSLIVEFGVKVSTEGNTFVTKAGAEANLSVSIKWDFS